MADAAKIAEHIRARIAKSGLDSPSVNITREGWGLILMLLEGHELAEKRAEALLAAINYTIEGGPGGDGLEWLRAWAEGDEEAMRELEAHLAAEAPPHGDDR